MADFPLPDGMVFSEVAGVETTTSLLTTFTSGSTDAFSSASEIIASTSDNTTFLALIFGHQENVIMSEIRVRVLIGSAGNEEVIIDVNSHIKGNLGPHSTSFHRVSIPSSSRLSIQVACDSGGRDIGVSVLLFKPSFTTHSPFGRVDIIGMDGTEISEGTTVDPGGTANTKGSWTEITASLSETLKNPYILFGAADNDAMSNANFLLDIAVGGSGSEEVIISNLPFMTSSQETSRPPIQLPITMVSGQRYAARLQCDITDATDRLVTISFAGQV